MDAWRREEALTKLGSNYEWADNGCLVWMGAKTSCGYGVVRVNKRPMNAHRLVWELVHGPIADGLHVLHACDNPPCFNPDHLSLGTHADNMRDMWAKGRNFSAQGEAHSHAKLTEELVRQIRASDETNTTWARRLGVSHAAISGIRRNLTWRHIL